MIRFLLLLTPFCIYAALEENPYDKLILKGIDAAQRQEYDEADSIFNCIPDTIPAPFFFKAIMLHAKMTEEHDFRCAKQLYEYCERTIAIAQRDIENNVNLAQAHFYNGGGYGAMGTTAGKTGSWISSMRHGMKGVAEYQKALEIDSTIYDAYAGLGIYHYWKGEVTKYFHWLPFVDDERKQGKKELLIATEKGKYLNHVARYSFIWVYFKEEEYDSSIALCEQFLSRYPYNTIFLRARADILFQQRDWKKSVEEYLNVIELIRRKPNQNTIEIMECLYKLAKALELSDKKVEALQYYSRILELEAPEWNKKESEDLKKKTLSTIKYLKKELEASD